MVIPEALNRLARSEPAKALAARLVEQALAAGLRVEGPVPADTTFFKAYDGIYDGIVAMYHDQGHTPVKLVAFDTGVNVTLGLPIVRTSVFLSLTAMAELREITRSERR